MIKNKFAKMFFKLIGGYRHGGPPKNSWNPSPFVGVATFVGVGVMLILIVIFFIWLAKKSKTKTSPSTPKTETTPIKWPIMCKKNSDCPKRSYCMNDNTKTAPYYCKQV